MQFLDLDSIPKEANQSIPASSPPTEPAAVPRRNSQWRRWTSWLYSLVVLAEKNKNVKKWLETLETSAFFLGFAVLTGHFLFCGLGCCDVMCVFFFGWGIAFFFEKNGIMACLKRPFFETLRGFSLCNVSGVEMFVWRILLMYVSKYFFIIGICWIFVFFGWNILSSVCFGYVIICCVSMFLCFAIDAICRHVNLRKMWFIVRERTTGWML